MRTRSILGVEAVIAVVALAVPLVSTQDVRDLPAPIAVTIVQPTPHGLSRAVRYIPRGATLGGVIAEFGLKPKAGDFVDVAGVPIRRGAYPGHVELNGQTAPRTARVSEGGVVSVVDGQNRTEPKVTEVVTVPGGRVSNPQFYLDTTPGREVLVKGSISGKLASSSFQATGPTQTKNEVALTFDDGPSPVYTPQILTILNKFHVKATFFTIGFEVAEFPWVIKEELKAGMAVADHTWDHPIRPPFRDLSLDRIRSEMSLCQIALEKVGATPHLFRPPGGSYSDIMITTAKRLGLRIVLWSVDPQDWRNDLTANQIVSNVLSHVHAGSIVEMHDGGGFQNATVAALPKIIKGIQKKGLKLVAITS